MRTHHIKQHIPRLSRKTAIASGSDVLLYQSEDLLLVVDSKSRQKVLVDLVLTPASDMVVEARLNEFESSYSLRGGATQEIQFTATLEEGKNELLFESAVKPIRLNKGDPRFFSFMINSVKTHANEN